VLRLYSTQFKSHTDAILISDISLLFWLDSDHETEQESTKKGQEKGLEDGGKPQATTYHQYDLVK
jgi:hypothetical protein